MLKAIRHLALDMDGTIYRGKTLFDFTIAFLRRMNQLGIGYTFLTNNCSRSVRHYMAHLGEMGIEVRKDQVYTSALSTIDYLRGELPQVRRLWVLGTPSLCEEFTEAGFEVVADGAEPEAIVVSIDTGLTYARLCKTAWWIKQGKPFVATHPDRVCPTDQPPVMVDCGSLCACLLSAAGRSPQAVLGKPHPSMLRGILRRHALQPHELAMVGDRFYTDMAMARSAGAVGVLVLTGEATEREAREASPPPDLVVPSLKELGERLAEASARRG